MISFAADGKTLEPIAPWQRPWALLFIFDLTDYDADGDADPDDQGDYIEWLDQHLDWCARHYDSPDECLKPSSAFWRRWQRFKAAHAGDSLAEIDRLLGLFLTDV
jgi:hypothetical protein